MSEMREASNAYRLWANAVDIPQTIYWSNGYYKYTYGTRAIFDAGWAAAMDYVEAQKRVRDDLHP